MYIVNNLEAAETLVEKQREMGNDIRWDNYTIKVFRPHPLAWRDRAGAFRGGQWGFDNSYPVRSDGTWHIDPRSMVRGG